MLFECWHAHQFWIWHDGAWQFESEQILPSYSWLPTCPRPEWAAVGAQVAPIPGVFGATMWGDQRPPYRAFVLWEHRSGGWVEIYSEVNF